MPVSSWLYTDGRCVSLQTEAYCRVESKPGEECVWGSVWDLRAGLRQGGQPGWRRHLGGAALVQTRVGRPAKQIKYVKNTDQKYRSYFNLCVVFLFPFVSVPSIPLCTLINQHLSMLARKFPQTKFLKSISTTCIPNYPDRNLPTIFVYFESEMKAQFIGPLVFGGMNLKVEGTI